MNVIKHSRLPFLCTACLLSTLIICRVHPLGGAEGPTEVAASAPQDPAAELAARRLRIAEQMALLAPAEDASTESVAQSGATSDAEEELDLLKTLDLLYVQHQAALEQRLEVENLKRQLQGELETLRTFGPPEAKPYSFLLLEDIRDQWAAEESRQEANASNLAAAHQLLESARERFDECEHERRLAQETLEDNEEPEQQATLARDLKLAELNSQIGHETVALRRLEIEVTTARAEICKLRQTLLGEKIERIAKDVQFTERDLKSRLNDLTRSAQQMKRSLKEAESRLQQLDTLQARTIRELTEQQADKAHVASVNEAFQVARRTLHEEITLIPQRLGEIDHFKHYWDCRYDVINGKSNKDELEEWRESLEQFLERLQQTERTLALRLDEIRLDQATLFRRSQEADGQSDDTRKWVDFQADHLRRLADLCETSRLHLKSSQRSAQRFLEDLEKRIEPEEKRDLLGPAMESLTAFWHYEIASVDDRPITVGKIVTALAYLLIGVLAARILSRILGNRILPRFGFNEGASHAVQSMSFYSLCVIFALVSLQLVNLPLTAFTFLGGAAAIGLGFGSQSILNNFISGLILLAEQPIRVGDLVEIDGVQGMVERIGARSTRVKTVSNHEIIVPNSKLLENKVTNLTLTDNLVQTAIGISLSPIISVDEARELLQHAATTHPKVLSQPEPVVLFKEFSTTLMSFELHFWLPLHSVMECRIVESEVREKINSLFRHTDASTTPINRAVAGPVVAAPPRPMRDAG